MIEHRLDNFFSIKKYAISLEIFYKRHYLCKC